MKQFLAILTILVMMFALSCTKSQPGYAPQDQKNVPENSSVTVKGGEDDGEDEGEGEGADKGEPEGEGDEEGEPEGEEGEGEEPAAGDPEEEPVATPESIIEGFVLAHFPETAVAEIEESDEGYEVKLEDGTQINFDENLEWHKVSCKHSTVYTAVPESIVPEEISAYVAENYPDNTIMDIKKTGFGWMVTLDSKGKIKFNADFSIK